MAKSELICEQNLNWYIGCQNEGEWENYEFDRNNEYDSAEEDCQ